MAVYADYGMSTVHPTETVESETSINFSETTISLKKKIAKKTRHLTRRKLLLILASLSLLFLVCTTTVVHADNYPLVLTFGGFGSGDGQFRNPLGVAVDSSGYVYVCDYQNNANCRIEKFDSNGNFIKQIGSCGTNLGQFKTALSCAVYGSLLYVADEGNHRIDIFDLDGNYITSWSKSYLTNPYGIAVDSSGNVYVTDYSGTLYTTEIGYVLVFDPSGNLLRYWGTFAKPDPSPPAFYYHASGIAVSASGYVYVADEDNRIFKFDTSGNFKSSWGSTGSGNGQFKQPCGVAVDNSGNVYVADAVNGRVQEFDGDGNFISVIGNGQFLSAQWVAVDHLGYVYVSDSSDFRDNVKKFAPSEQVTFSATGLDSDAGSNTVLTVGGVNYAYNALPLTVWINAGTTFSWASPVAGASLNERFIKTGETGNSPISAGGAYSATYQKQFQVTFDAVGLNGDAGSSVILNLDGSLIDYGALPDTVWVSSGATFSWAGLVGGVAGERFDYVSDSGLASPITGPGTDTAVYSPKFQVTFDAVGLNGDAGSSVILNLDGSLIDYGALPDTVWVSSGATFSWAGLVGGVAGERFDYVSDSGLASPITGPGTDTAVYSRTSPSITVNISPSTVTASLNQQQLFTGSISGGTPPFYYNWYIDGALSTGGSGVPAGTDVYLTYNFGSSTSTSHIITLTVTDSTGTQASATAFINPQGSTGFFTAITPNPVYINVGTAQTFTVTSQGTAPFTYHWFINGATATGDPNTATLTWTPSAEAIYHVSVHVIDSVGGTSDSTATVYATLPNPVSGPYLQIAVLSPVNILVTDQNGHRVGADAAGTVYNEIPGATYSGAGTEPQVITLPDSNPGDYSIQMFGTGTGPFTVTVINTATDGSTLGTGTWKGTVSQGETWGTGFTVTDNGSVQQRNMFVVPEYLLGGLLALAASFTALAAFKMRRHERPTIQNL